MTDLRRRVLLALLRAPKPPDGPTLRRAAGEATKADFYPEVTRLELERLIVSGPANVKTGRGARDERTYWLSPTGRALATTIGDET